jgi:hypothetical protein
MPEGLDRVELWGVARLKDQRHIEILGLLLDDLCHVAPMIVDHNVQVRIFAEGASLSYLHEEVAYLDLVGRSAQHVDEMLEEGTDGTVHSDATNAALVDNQLDRFGHCSPSMCLPHPRVEAGFVEVDYRGLLMNQLCKLDSELLALIDKLFVESSMICGRR